MNWLAWPILPKRLWPPVKFRNKRAIKREEHERIIAREGNRERRDFYRLCWHLGGSQTDVAMLEGEDIDWTEWTVCYNRKKLASLDETDVKPPLIKFGKKCAAVLKSLPQTGPLFPYLRTVRAGDRATEFKQRSKGLGIKASPCSRTAMPGPSGQRRTTFPSATRSMLWGTTPRPSTAPMPSALRRRWCRLRITKRPPKAAKSYTSSQAVKRRRQLNGLQPLPRLRLCRWDDPLGASNMLSRTITNQVVPFDRKSGQRLRRLRIAFVRGRAARPAAGGAEKR